VSGSLTFTPAPYLLEVGLKPWEYEPADGAVLGVVLNALRATAGSTRSIYKAGGDQWRPSIVISSPAGSGKSSFFAGLAMLLARSELPGAKSDFHFMPRTVARKVARKVLRDTYRADGQNPHADAIADWALAEHAGGLDGVRALIGDLLLSLAPVQRLYVAALFDEVAQLLPARRRWRMGLSVVRSTVAGPRAAATRGGPRGPGRLAPFSVHNDRGRAWAGA